MCKSPVWVALAIGLLRFLPPPAEANTLFGLEAWQKSTRLCQISTLDAAVTLVGEVSMPPPVGLAFAPDGQLYGLTGGGSAFLYRLDPRTADVTAIAPLPLGVYMAEGGLAFAPDGTAYAVMGLDGLTSNRELLRIDVITGRAAIVGTIEVGEYSDINGLTWRSDGTLVGLDGSSNSLIGINPKTAFSYVIADVDPVAGLFGGMTSLDGETGYFATAGPGAQLPGSNELYSFDLFTGEHTRIGSFSPTISGEGFVGLAIIPEPTSFSLLGLGSLTLAMVRRRKTKA